MVIVFAGLPGSGKSTLAQLLATKLPAVLLNKDIIRAALFAADQVEYSGRQNDFCMEILYTLADYHLKYFPERHIIIDGRTFSRKHHVTRLLERAAGWTIPWAFIECQASLETLQRRVSADAENHLAADRTADLVKRSYGEQDSFELERLVIPTDSLSVDQAFERVWEYVQKQMKISPIQSQSSM